MPGSTRLQWITTDNTVLPVPVFWRAGVKGWRWRANILGSVWVFLYGHWGCCSALRQARITFRENWKVAQLYCCCCATYYPHNSLELYDTKICCLSGYFREERVNVAGYDYDFNSADRQSNIWQCIMRAIDSNSAIYDTTQVCYYWYDRFNGGTYMKGKMLKLTIIITKIMRPSLVVVGSVVVHFVSYWHTSNTRIPVYGVSTN